MPEPTHEVTLCICDGCGEACVDTSESWHKADCPSGWANATFTSVQYVPLGQERAEVLAEVLAEIEPRAAKASAAQATKVEQTAWLNMGRESALCRIKEFIEGLPATNPSPADEIDPDAELSHYDPILKDPPPANPSSTEGSDD